MRIICILTLFLITHFLIGQSPVIAKKHRGNPPGCVKMPGSFLFVDETEVSNIHWKEFLNWLQKNDTSQYRQMLPDTNVWNSRLAYNKFFVKNYFQHPAYRDYPVVGISYSQAQAYCKWRSDRVLEYYRFKNFPIKKLIYRLPTEEEWKKAAWGTLAEGSIWPWKGEEIGLKEGKKVYKGLSQLNFKGISWSIPGYKWEENSGGFLTTPVYSYWPNTIGLYNMCGNVAEWTEEHKTMGGSWNDYLYHCQITTPKPILPDSSVFSTVGFRCVAEIVEYEDEFKIEALKWSTKKIEKQLIPISNTDNGLVLFASETEVSNQEYNTFLNEVGSKGHEIANLNWSNHTRYLEQQLYGWHKAYADYPVVNIEYQDALAYCQWITNKYNSSPKKKYKKVVFKLPTLDEWKKAAGGGRKNKMYPWRGTGYISYKEKYLANFCPLESQYLDSIMVIKMKPKKENSGPRNVYQPNRFDTISFYDTTLNSYKGTLDFEPNSTSPKIISYNYAYTYPNNDKTISRGKDGFYFTANLDAAYSYFGLYCMAGNVSEMLAEKGKAKGGNWTSSQYEIQINSPTETYTQANCTLGFRVFMEVLER